MDEDKLYKKMYHTLLDSVDKAIEDLQNALREAEEIYIGVEEEEEADRE